MSHQSTSSDSAAAYGSAGQQTVITEGPPISDEEATRRFEELYRTHYQKIVTYARRRTRSADEADDVVSATFLVAWRRLEDLVGADEPLAWLYRVAYLTLLNHRRDAERTGRLTDKAAAEYPNPAATIESTVEARDRLAQVAAAAEILSEMDRELLRLVAWEELTHSEIAEILGISRVLVRTRLSRARRRLQAAYDKRLGGKRDKRLGGERSGGLDRD